MVVKKRSGIRMFFSTTVYPFMPQFRNSEFYDEKIKAEFDLKCLKLRNDDIIIYIFIHFSIYSVIIGATLANRFEAILIYRVEDGIDARP